LCFAGNIVSLINYKNADFTSLKHYLLKSVFHLSGGDNMSNVTRRNFIKAGSLLTAATALGAGYSHSAWAAKRPKFRLKYANNLPISHPMNIRAKEMVEAIAAESDGEIEIRIYP